MELDEDALFDLFLETELKIDRASYEIQATDDPRLRKYVRLAFVQWLNKKGLVKKVVKRSRKKAEKHGIPPPV